VTIAGRLLRTTVAVIVLSVLRVFDLNEVLGSGWILLGPHRISIKIDLVFRWFLSRNKQQLNLLLYQTRFMLMRKKE